MATQAPDMPSSMEHSDQTHAAQSSILANDWLNQQHQNPGPGVAPSSFPVQVVQQHFSNTPLVTTPEDGQPLFQHPGNSTEILHGLPHPQSGQGPILNADEHQMTMAVKLDPLPSGQSQTLGDLNSSYNQHIMAVAAAAAAANHNQNTLQMQQQLVSNQTVDAHTLSNPQVAPPCYGNQSNPLNTSQPMSAVPKDHTAQSEGIQIQGVAPQHSGGFFVPHGNTAPPSLLHSPETPIAMEVKQSAGEHHQLPAQVFHQSVGQQGGLPQQSPSRDTNVEIIGNPPGTVTLFDGAHMAHRPSHEFAQSGHVESSQMQQLRQREEQQQMLQTILFAQDQQAAQANMQSQQHADHSNLLVHQLQFENPSSAPQQLHENDQDQAMAEATAAAAQQAMAEQIAIAQQQQQERLIAQQAAMHQTVLSPPQSTVNESAVNQSINVAGHGNMQANPVMLQQADQLVIQHQHPHPGGYNLSHASTGEPRQSSSSTNQQLNYTDGTVNDPQFNKPPQMGNVAYSTMECQTKSEAACFSTNPCQSEPDSSTSPRNKRRSGPGQITIPPVPAASEFSLDTQSTPALSETVAQRADVSAKEFEGMTREQLIARLMELEQEKRANRAETSGGQQQSVEASEMKSEASTNLDEEEEDAPSTPPDTDRNNRTESIAERSGGGNDDAEELDDEDEEDEGEGDQQEQAASKPMQCLWKNCGQMCDGMQSLIAHITDNHVGSGKPTYLCEWEGCPRNQKPFTKRHKMYNHLRTHTGERPFVCQKEGCGKRFSRPDSLTTHIKTHSNVRPYICSFKGCHKAYYHSRSLKKHEKTHEIPTTTATYMNPASYSFTGPAPVNFMGNMPMPPMQQQQGPHVSSEVHPSHTLQRPFHALTSQPMTTPSGSFPVDVSQQPPTSAPHAIGNFDANPTLPIQQGVTPQQSFVAPEMIHPTSSAATSHSQEFQLALNPSSAAPMSAPFNTMSAPSNYHQGDPDRYNGFRGA